MINHLRTLLMNQSGTGATEFPGEEYVPPGFLPLPVPPVIQKIRHQIFGNAPERFTFNYRLRQLLPMLHASVLEEHILEFDRRVTYWPQPSRVIYDYRFGATAKALSGSTVLTLIGNLPPEQASGRLSYRWTVEATATDELQITEIGSNLSRMATLTFTAGLSQAVPLLVQPNGAGLAMMLQMPVIGDTWRITAVAQPTLDLAAVIAELDQSLSEADMDALFGAHPVEPDKTFKNLWQQHKQLPYRIGGLLLAVGRRMEEIRLRGGL